jgi:opacity protein-like surface antigen
MKILTLSALAVVFLVLAYAADIAGKWTSEFDSQVGKQKYTYDLKVSGDKITGQAISDQRGPVEITEGKITGDQISFVEKANIQGNDIRIEYTGKVTGDEMKLTRKVGDFATYEIVAKRAK